ncbi:ring finger protein, partial [Diplocarpon rosae]
MDVSRCHGLQHREPVGSSKEGNVVIDLTSDDEEKAKFHASAHLTKRKKTEARIDQDPRNFPSVVDALPEFRQADPNGALQPVQNNFGDRGQAWDHYALDKEFSDELMAGASGFDQEFVVHPPPPLQPTQAVPAQLQAAQPCAAQLAPHVPVAEDFMDSRVGCVDNLVNIFPGICRDYVSELYDTVSKSSEHLIAHVLDEMEKGASYPNAKDKQKQLKRKRELDEDQEAARKYGASDREIPTGLAGTRAFIRTKSAVLQACQNLHAKYLLMVRSAKILSMEFPFTAMTFIQATCTNTKYRLFSAYKILEKAERNYDKHNNAPYPRLKGPRKCQGYTPAEVAAYLAAPPRTVTGDVDHERIAVYEELQLARRIKAKADACREAERAIEVEEEANIAKAEAEGTMSECECCCCDYPLNRMVHCNGDIVHWFCRGCAKQNAEVEIGKSKYELCCMSTVQCTAGFSSDQRALFLDAKTTAALERIEQESILHAAGIANLACCPFCPFAAEYPPIEENSEFTCQAPDCERVSCRRCRLDSHIPKSCAEYATENGLSIRHQIEEAMSTAMIRKCNKCDTPFVKEEGCNKMTCTRNGCRNIQCYVCHMSCDYSHFNDQRRGGKVGNCPLFESAEQRHDEEVKKAEQEILDKVLAAHPQYTMDDLKIKMSEEVKKDDDKRKALDSRVRQLAMQQGAIVAMQQRAQAGQ